MIEKYPCLYENAITKPILSSLQIEEDILYANVLDVRDQLFLDTATWGIEKWENLLSIPKNSNLSLFNRKENIKAKLRTRGTTSLSVIKNICESYSNGEVEIEENYADYSFKIIFSGSIGVPTSMVELDKTIEEIKPCHLAHSYEYKYNTNEILSAHTHVELSEYTHEQLRNEKNLR